MDQEILEKFNEEDRKLEEISVSLKKIRQYFFWTFVVTLATIILPLLGLIVAVPWFLRTLTSAYGI